MSWSEVNIPTDAKEIAIYFLDITNSHASKAFMATTIIQAKQLLNRGYTMKQIKNTIKYVYDVKNPNMYSLAYITASIDSMQKEMKELEARKPSKYDSSQFEEGETDFEQQAKRNKDKLHRFGKKPGFGKEHYIDMLKK